MNEVMCFTCISDRILNAKFYWKIRIGAYWVIRKSDHSTPILPFHFSLHFPFIFNYYSFHSTPSHAVHCIIVVFLHITITCIFSSKNIWKGLQFGIMYFVVRFVSEFGPGPLPSSVSVLASSRSCVTFTSHTRTTSPSAVSLIVHRRVALMILYNNLSTIPYQ
jgi:hypothetical protein